MGISIWQLLIVLVIILILFGPGRLPRLMKDIGKGVHQLREGLKGKDEEGDKKEKGKKQISKKEKK